MRYLRVAVAILLVLALLPFCLRSTAAVADDEDVPGAAILYEREWVVKPMAPLSKRVALVMDASGSMYGASLALARHEIVTILSLFSDDGHVKVYAFASCVSVWRREWTPLPDQEALEQANAWMASLPAGGNTDLGGAVSAALANPSPELCVVLVSDGAGDWPHSKHVRAVEEAQAARPSPAPIFAIGVTPEHPAADGLLKKIAEESHGGYLRIQRRAAH